ncbi:MAG: DNA-binding protein [Acidimicrobiaceae bacterium]|nr:DNA-binding protein [Acidimicrobiaceae bacterium]|tara:strand:+ start:173 stop:598 length:426 start_codon:yes stop_codon:yes gene_type:complete
MGDQVPIEEGLFTWPSDSPKLVGSECQDCGAIVFPAQSGCPRCTSDNTETKELGTRGKLWTWTIQGFPPKSPPYQGDVDAFEPFGVGYVEIHNEVKVETRLTVADKEVLEIGMEMELTFIPLFTDDEGNEVITFAFAPLAS